jgi:predicted CXXCH cytochrome family protein
MDLLKAVRAAFLLLAPFALVSAAPGVLRAADGAGPAPEKVQASEVTETCLDCHGDADLQRDNGESVHVPADEFLASVHGRLDCTDCHQDVDPDDLPHAEKLEKVRCVDCHDNEQVDFDASVHGQALHRGAPYAPECTTCHGVHDILSAKDPASPTFKMKIPYLCGGCHREGAPVARTYDIAEHNIVDNYSQSIHGEGLFKKGLMVTATCTDCHRAHMILPHSDPRASISPRNIANTCMQCHSRIEDVHAKVIRGELWEKKPGAIPACTDCHLPHRVRKETVALTISDRDCMKCHQDAEHLHLAAGADTTLLVVDRQELSRSMHVNIPCVKCHSDIDPRLHRPCETAKRVDCSACHAKISEEYFASGHGQGFLKGMPEVPYCTTCHGSHGVKSHEDDTAPTYRAAVPALCGRCHGSGRQAAKVADLSEEDALADYSTSVHGRGLTEKGLLPSAVCIDCHGSHEVLGHKDPRSTVNPKNLPATCATCHRGIYKQFVKSVHFDRGDSHGKRLPTCEDCHSAHRISDTKKDTFLTEITDQCGSCHQELAASYFDTMHGKAYKLGYLSAAKCSDCHGAHDILSVNDPQSSVGIRNIVQTCRKCHDDANARFTGYLTHATHHDPRKYPALYWTYWSMTSLLVGVFAFFGIHTLMWLPRSFAHYRERKAFEKAHRSRYFIRRFNRTQRFTHLLVIVSFLSLATTGMMLKFSTTPWAIFLANALGGVKHAGVIHRTAAVITFGYFALHLTSLIRLKRQRRLSFGQLVLGPDSLVFNGQDLKDFWATMKWFLGRGPRPQYGRWTYWEKFDYLAVFWGVAIIGLSGLMLWFPEFFTRFLPGWLINVATIIHSDEALLAVGFIFTIHFFNTHLRPEAFPMDTVVFTGIAPVDEYRRDRPREYEELKRTGQLKKRLTKDVPTRTRRILVRVFGSLFLGIGLVLIALILYSVLFGYR